LPVKKPSPLNLDFLLIFAAVVEERINMASAMDCSSDQKYLGVAAVG